MPKPKRTPSAGLLAFIGHEDEELREFVVHGADDGDGMFDCHLNGLVNMIFNIIYILEVKLLAHMRVKRINKA
jgi:hypothetical protein